jgi:putative ABC transport system permease protein
MYMNVVTRGIRNAFRNVIRTLSVVTILGLSMGLSLVMLIANQGVSDKIDSVKQSIGNTITIRPAGFSGSSDTNNALTVDQLSKVREIDHVVSLTESMSGRLKTTGSDSLGDNNPEAQSQGGGISGETNLVSPVELNKDGEGGGMVLNSSSIPDNFSPPISVWGTTNPTGTIGELNIGITLTDGTAIDGTKDSDKVLISESMAKKNNLEVGSTFTAYGATLTVEGLFTTDTKSGDNFVIMPLLTLQRLTDNANAVTSASVAVDSVSNIDAATEDVKELLSSSADVTNSKKTIEDAIQPLLSIQNISLYSLIGAVVAAAVIILLTMIMIVRERKREIGVVKAIGFSNIRIVTQFMAEALTLTLLGAMAGLVIGVVAGNPVTQALVDNSANSASSSGGGRFTVNRTIEGITNIQTIIGWEVILFGIGAAVLIAIVGSALASYFIAKVRPAEVLRSE